jgi:hypothetical protein
MNAAAEQAPHPLRRFTVAHIKQVYSGKQGCMCGCLGKYSVNPAFKAQVDRERGYATNGGSGLRMVAKVLRILQADPRTVIEDGIAFIPDSLLADTERAYVAYLAAEVA